MFGLSFCVCNGLSHITKQVAGTLFFSGSRFAGGLCVVYFGEMSSVCFLVQMGVCCGFCAHHAVFLSKAFVLVRLVDCWESVGSGWGSVWGLSA